MIDDGVSVEIPFRIRERTKSTIHRRIHRIVQTYFILPWTQDQHISFSAFICKVPFVKTEKMLVELSSENSSFS